MTTVTLDTRFKNDQVFNEVSKQFITLKDHEMQEYNIHLRTVLDAFIEEMKKKDPIFKACFRRIAYVGSYYEGLKVGKPEEFDLNIIINLPIDYSTLRIIIATEKPGYIKLQGTPDMLEKLQKHVRWAEYNGCYLTWDLGGEFESGNSYRPQENHFTIKLEKFFTKKKWYYRQNANAKNNHKAQSNFDKIPDDNSSAKSRTVPQRRISPKKKGMEKWIDPKHMYLDQNKFRQWFESVGTRALGSYQYIGGKYVLNANGKRYLLNHKKSGPAWTLKIDVPGGHTVDVDLVPALEFSTPPPKPFRNHNTKKQNWFAISKPLDGPSNNFLWRPSFYEREQEILKGSVKQVIRQTKKLRDTQNLKSIASYYIKTLFLKELETLSAEFQKFPPTFQFFYMLQRLQKACAEHEIYDFWNPENNLLGNIGKKDMSNINFRLINIIKAIDRRITIDPYVIAEFILTKEELDQLKKSKLSNSMASLSLGSNSQTPQSPQNEGTVARIWNSFWRSEDIPSLP